MVGKKKIFEFAKQMGRQFNVQKIILFGSFASGSATEDSDVDLLVVLPFEGRRVDESVKIRLQLKPEFPVDLIIRKPEEIKERLAMGDPFIRQIIEEGKVIYEADNN